ncbi:TPR repeat protein [Seonamhaeicola aphaedonensis]|uniref:TPR repeat protein n=1 Tax=Seonamhaeicola aphaedonensis TaxID=1461338 RepID=A0A3D9H1M2_9FLAO|nr:TPR repeat protein [Seonamhaeicola aphaedonensis]
MTKNILLLFLLITIKSYCQKVNISELNGDWIKYKIEMKDGSSLIDRFFTDSSYVNYTFKKMEMCTNGNPTHRVNEVCFPYSLNQNFIKTSSTSGYEIERVKNDTLILCERIDGMEIDKLKRFYFVREQKLFNEIKIEKGESKNQIANEFYTPTLRSSLELELNKAFKNKHSNFKAKGVITIDLKNREINTLISYSNTSDSNKIKRVRKVIDKSYKLWDLKRFKHLETLEMPFVLKDEKTKTFRGISMKFFTNSFYQLDHFYGGDTRIIQKAGEYFNKAINSYQNKDYESSIKNFTKSYELDPKNIDALYNRAAIYYEIGKLELACKDWNELSELGQKKGIELLKNNCKKTTYNKELS